MHGRSARKTAPLAFYRQAASVVRCRRIFRGCFLRQEYSPKPHKKRMCLGTFSRRGAVASATIYLCAECASLRSIFALQNTISCKTKKTCSTGAGQQAALIDAANLRRCFEWKLLIAQNRQVSWLADLHLSGLLTALPQWHIRISSLLTVTSSLRLLPDSLFYTSSTGSKQI